MLKDNNPRLITLAITLLIFSMTLTTGTAWGSYNLELASEREASRERDSITQPTRPFSRPLVTMPVSLYHPEPAPSEPEADKPAPEPSSKPERKPEKKQPKESAKPKGSVRDRVLATWPGDDVWADKVVSCESGYDFQQHGGQNNSNCCWGGWQFMISTWHQAGMSGNPIDYSVEEQTRTAWSWLKKTSSSQWACSPYAMNP